MSDKVSKKTKSDSEKLTRNEKNWVLYDVGNSAFVLLVATLIPIFFDALGEKGGLSNTTYLAYWGYASSVATLISAFAGPFLGAVSDRKDKKRSIFLVTIAVGSIGCLALGFAQQWLAFLIVFVIARVAFNLSLVVYDSMLGDVTTEDRLEKVSSHGYAWGYIGSCIPFIVCLALYVLATMEVLPISDITAMAIGFVLTGLWWFFVSLPLYKSYKQVHYLSEEEIKAQPNVFTQLGHSIKDAAQDKKIGLFLLAFFFYIDGVYTIIDMATAYGTSLGMDTVGLLGALLLTQIVAFPSAIIIGKLAKKYKVENLICICIMGYFFMAVYAIWLDSLAKFWILAFCVGLFQGGIQALSRSYFTRIIPAEKSGEFFGLYDILGKGAAFLGTTLISVVTQLTGKQNLGVGAISIFFIIGLVIFLLSLKPSKKAAEPEQTETTAAAEETVQ